jgi:hypothetical protein
MRRLAFSVLSVCAIMMMSGCCLPNLFYPCGGGSRGGFGCPNGRCGVQQPGYPPQTGWNSQPGVMQTNYGAPAIQQQGPVAFHQPYPTMAIESLPTYR